MPQRPQSPRATQPSVAVLATRPGSEHDRMGVGEPADQQSSSDLLMQMDFGGHWTPVETGQCGPWRGWLSPSGHCRGRVSIPLLGSFSPPAHPPWRLEPFLQSQQSVSLSPGGLHPWGPPELRPGGPEGLKVGQGWGRHTTHRQTPTLLAVLSLKTEMCLRV